MRKIKYLVLVVVLVALMLVHKNPLSEKDVNAIAPAGEQVEQSVNKSKDALGFLTDKTQLIWSAIKENLGYKDNNAAESGSKPEERTEDTTSEAEAFQLLAVIDGDTIVIDNQGVNTKVRMIGIDTPESVHEDESKNTVYGTYASDYTKNLLKDVDTVYLTFDEELTDQYNRILAYVWLEKPTDVNDINEIENKMVNYNILVTGYAVDKVFMPNDKYAETFNTARCDAQKQGIGLWQYNEYVALVEK